MIEAFSQELKFGTLLSQYSGTKPHHYLILAIKYHVLPLATCYLLSGYTEGGAVSKRAFSACLDDLISQAVTNDFSIHTIDFTMAVSTRYTSDAIHCLGLPRSSASSWWWEVKHSGKANHATSPAVIAGSRLENFPPNDGAVVALLYPAENC